MRQWTSKSENITIAQYMAAFEQSQHNSPNEKNSVTCLMVAFAAACFKSILAGNIPGGYRRKATGLAPSDSVYFIYVP